MFKEAFWLTKFGSNLEKIIIVYYIINNNKLYVNLYLPQGSHLLKILRSLHHW